VCAPVGYLYFLSFQLLNELELDAGINPGMAFQFRIGLDSNPRPCNRESSSLTTRPDFRLIDGGSLLTCLAIGNPDLLWLILTARAQNMIL